ncbi:MAG: hypothetical protein EOP45_13575 [Sphingobacteriaceae bacterium]|nr:MAG: hypothetical protein EOP45_13575 [Sphingobacteriaceae bacterium]
MQQYPNLLAFHHYGGLLGLSNGGNPLSYVIAGERYCLPLLYYKNIFESSWFPHQVESGDVMYKRKKEVWPQVQLASLPRYNIFKCVEKNLTTLDETLPHNKHLSPELIELRANLVEEKHNIENAIHADFPTNRSLTMYIFIKVANEYVALPNDPEILQRYVLLRHKSIW